MRSPRLYVETPLAAGIRVEPGAEAAHYLLRVLRLGPGARVRLFNGRDGEWSALVEAGDRKRLWLVVGEQLRPPQAAEGPVLFVAPPRRSRFEWLVEKATELGVGRIVPVLTQRTVAKPEKLSRLQTIATEAAEQSERLDRPAIEPLCPLAEVLIRLQSGWLLLADEAGGRPLLQALEETSATAFLVGPEGGFDAAEREVLRAHPRVIAVTLGPRILRVETAAVAMLACWQAFRDAGHAQSLQIDAEATG